MIEEAVGFVLAGGQSTRMGTDKALIELRGKPLIAHAVECLRNAGLRAHISGARSDLAGFAPLIHDPTPHRGPLAGICAALAQSSAEVAVFLSVDMPLFPASALAFLAARALVAAQAVTLFAVNGFPQTFPAAVRRDALPALQAELDHGSGGCFAAFRAAAQARGEQVAVLPVELLVQTSHIAHPKALPASRWFANVNTPCDLQRASAWFGAAIA